MWHEVTWLGVRPRLAIVSDLKVYRSTVCKITAILIMNAETPPTLCNQSESVCADEHNSSATCLFTTGDST